MLAEQIAFRPTGSTNCVFVHFMHHVSLFRETDSYVRVLFIEFFKAFDIVDQGILLSNLVALGLLPVIENWVISFF